MKRGEVYLATLAPRSGSEQQGTRPVIVVSNDAFNDVPNWRSIVIVPCSTSSNQASRGPSVVPLVRGAGGLTNDSVALCHQITTLDRAKLTTRWGALTPAELATVEAGIKAALDMR